MCLQLREAYTNALAAREDRGLRNRKAEGTLVAIPAILDRGGGTIIDPQGRMNNKVDPKETAPTLRAQCHGNEPLVMQKISQDDIETSKLYNQRGTVHSVNGVARTVVASHSGNEPKIAIPLQNIDAIGKLNPDRHSDTDILSGGGVASTLSARDFKGPKMVAVELSPLEIQTPLGTA